MSKKLFFFGTLALLSASLFMLGCPTDSDADTKIVYQNVPVPGPAIPDIVPDNAVPTGSEPALHGMLLSTDVSVIEYTGTLSKELFVPTGKTVYLRSASSLSATNRVIVESGAKVVFVNNVTITAATSLLVNGEVQIGPDKMLDCSSVGALGVAGYEVEDDDDIVSDGATAIGKRVKVLAVDGVNGTLKMKSDDIVPTTAANKFTLAEAWAAASPGNLDIAVGTLDLTVTKMLESVSPSAARRFKAATSGATDFPNRIPEGAYITVSGSVATVGSGSDTTLTVDGTLNVSGGLANVTAITVGPHGDLTANDLTGANLTKIAVNGGRFVQPSNPSTTEITDITITRGSEFTLEKDTFDKLAKLKVEAGSEATLGTTTSTFALLKEVDVGLGGTVALTGTSGAEFAELKTLNVGVGASFEVTGAGATFAGLTALDLKTAAQVTVDTAVAAFANLVSLKVARARFLTPPLRLRLTPCLLRWKWATMRRRPSQNPPQLP
jgi:hypothetical protein